MPKKPDEVQKFMDKVKKMEKGHKLDLSSGEDLSIGIMNLISLEEHLFFTAKKTNNAKFWDLLNEIRIMRVSLMKRIIKDYNGETWCMSKHLLAASMRLMEVGTKALKNGDKAQAEEMFDKAYDLYNLFWGLGLDLVGTKDAAQMVTSAKTTNWLSETNPPQVQAKVSVFAKLGEMVKHAVDCCRE